MATPNNITTRQYGPSPKNAPLTFYELDTNTLYFQSMPTMSGGYLPISNPSQKEVQLGGGATITFAEGRALTESVIRQIGGFGTGSVTWIGLSGSLAVTGGADISTVASVGGTLSVGGAASFSASALIVGATTLGHTLSVQNATSLSSSLLAVGATVLGSTLSVAGATSLSGSLQVSGTSKFNNDVSITNARTFTVGTGNATFNGNVLAKANAEITGTLGVTGTSTLNGNVLAKANAEVTGTLGVTGNTSVGGALSVTGISTLNGNVLAKANAEVTGTLGVTGNTSVGGALGVTGVSTLNGNVLAKANAEVTGTLGVTGNTSIGGVLGVTGISTLNGNVLAKANAEVTGTLGVTGATYVAGTLTVVGNITGPLVNSLSVDDSSLQLNSGTSYNNSAAKTISIKTGGVTNAMLANSTISGKALGTNLDSLTIGTGLSGTSYNGSAAVTIANSGVTSAVAGTNIEVSAATGAVTVRVVDAPTFSGNATAAGFFQSSKRELKTDISKFEKNALDIINNTEVVEFKYKNDLDTVHIGIIADDSPEEIATKNKDKFDTNSTVAILLKAVQEMSAEIKELKEQLANK